MGVTHLVDTHVLLWLLSDPDRIDETVRGRLADRGNTLLVSVASALEVTTKVRIGKLDAGDLPLTFARQMTEMGAEILPIALDHALLAGTMSWTHRDPFDRLLVAQATVEDATFVTVDRALVDLPVPRILTW